MMASMRHHTMTMVGTRRWRPMSPLAKGYMNVRTTTAYTSRTAS